MPDQYELISLVDFVELEKRLGEGYEPYAVTFETGRRYYHLRRKVTFVKGKWVKV